MTEQRWGGRVVRDLLGDPILSGQRRFRTNMHRLVYRTGKHKARLNPDGPEIKQYPELAHLTCEEHAQVLIGVKARKEASAAGQSKGRDSAQWNRPRARTLWPGQHAHCAICGELMYRSGQHLKCQNALGNGPRTCWNHVHVPYGLLRAKVLSWVWSVLEPFPNFRTTIIEFAWKEFERQRRGSHRSSNVQAERIAELTRQAGNLAKAIARGGELEALVTESAAIQVALSQAKQVKQALNTLGRCGFYLAGGRGGASRRGIGPAIRCFIGFCRFGEAANSRLCDPAGPGLGLPINPATSEADSAFGRVERGG